MLKCFILCIDCNSLLKISFETLKSYVVMSSNNIKCYGSSLQLRPYSMSAKSDDLLEIFNWSR